MESDLADRFGDLYEPRLRSMIVIHLKKLPENEIMTFIMDNQPCLFYREALHIKATKCAALTRAVTIADRNPDTDIPEHYDWCKSSDEYMRQLTLEVEENRYHLAAFLNIFRDLVTSIAAAEKSGSLSKEELQVLRVKLQTVNDYYPTACFAAHGSSSSKRRLLTRSCQRWWLVSQMPKL